MNTAVKEKERRGEGPLLDQCLFAAGKVVALKMNGCLLITHADYFLRFTWVERSNGLPTDKSALGRSGTLLLYSGLLFSKQIRCRPPSVVLFAASIPPNRP